MIGRHLTMQGNDYYSYGCNDQDHGAQFTDYVIPSRLMVFHWEGVRGFTRLAGRRFRHHASRKTTHILNWRIDELPLKWVAHYLNRVAAAAYCSPGRFPVNIKNATARCHRSQVRTTALRASSRRLSFVRLGNHANILIFLFRR